MGGNIMDFLKKDSYWNGGILSAITPVILYFTLEFAVEKLSAILTDGIAIIQEHNILLVSIFLNLVIFYSYIHKKNYDKSGRAVLVITFIYTAIYLVWRFKELSF